MKNAANAVADSVYSPKILPPKSRWFSCVQSTNFASMEEGFRRSKGTYRHGCGKYSRDEFISLSNVYVQIILLIGQDIYLNQWEEIENEIRLYDE